MFYQELRLKPATVSHYKIKYTCILYHAYMQNVYVYMQDNYIYMQNDYVYMYAWLCMHAR